MTLFREDAKQTKNLDIPPIHVQDNCSLDFSRWLLKIDDKIVSSGEIGGPSNKNRIKSLFGKIKKSVLNIAESA